MMTRFKQIFVDTNILAERNSRPLGIDAFLRRVLVPEAAAALIQEDSGFSRSDALKTLKASRSYGLAVCGLDEEVEETEEERRVDAQTAAVWHARLLAITR